VSLSALMVSVVLLDKCVGVLQLYVVQLEVAAVSLHASPETGTDVRGRCRRRPR